MDKHPLQKSTFVIATIAILGIVGFPIVNAIFNMGYSTEAIIVILTTITGVAASYIAPEKIKDTKVLLSKIDKEATRIGTGLITVMQTLSSTDEDASEKVKKAVSILEQIQETKDKTLYQSPKTPK